MAKKVIQISPRQVACRANGAKGGKKAAKNLTAEQRLARALRGGEETLAKYGVDYFKHIGRMKKRPRSK